jgi:hypothetical protein
MEHAALMAFWIAAVLSCPLKIQADPMDVGQTIPSAIAPKPTALKLRLKLLTVKSVEGG